MLSFTVSVAGVYLPAGADAQPTEAVNTSARVTSFVLIPLMGSSLPHTRETLGVYRAENNQTAKTRQSVDPSSAHTPNPVGGRRDVAIRVAAVEDDVPGAPGIAEERRRRPERLRKRARERRVDRRVRLARVHDAQKFHNRG